MNTIKTWFGEEMSSSTSVEVRQFIRTNFIKLLVSDYTVYGISFLRKLLSILIDWVQNNFKVQAEVCIVLK